MERDAKEIEKMLKNGDKLYDDGDITQAKSIYKKVMKLADVGRHYDLVVDACLRLGPILSRQNDYSNMIKTYENALLVTRTYKLKFKEPMVYKRLGDGYWRVGALGMAKNYYKKCEDTLSYIDNESEKKFLTASLYIDGYGNLLDEEGKFEEAIKYYRKSLELLEDMGSRPKDDRTRLYTLYAKYNMGVAYERQGMSQEKLERPAKNWFEEAIKLFEEVRNMCRKSSYEFAISTLDAGFCYSKLNLISKAEEYTESALKILSKPQVSAKDLTAWAFMNKGIVARARNNFEKAIESFKSAIEIYEEIGIHEWTSMVYSELGLTYNIMGNKEKSKEAYKCSQEPTEAEREHVESPLKEKIEQAD